jgi:hypothetical protein
MPSGAFGRQHSADLQDGRWYSQHAGDEGQYDKPERPAQASNNSNPKKYKEDRQAG